MPQIKALSKLYEKDILSVINYCSNNISCQEFQIEEEEKFNTLFLNQIRIKNEKNISLKIKIITESYHKGLKQARKGKLNTAESYFKRGEKYRTGFDNEQNLIIDALTLPNISYLKYKKHLYEAAIIDLYSAINTIDQLINKGYSFLHAHKIQQVHNLIRIQLKLGNTKTAMRFNSQLLQHIINKSTLEWKVGNWDPTLLLKVPTTLLESLTFQVANEMINNIILASKLNKESLQKYFQFAFKGIKPSKETIIYYSPFQIIRQYCYLMELYFSEKYELFISTAKIFICKAPHFCDIWKYLLLRFFQDIIRLETNKEEFYQIESTINDFVKQHLNIEEKAQRIFNQF